MDFFKDGEVFRHDDSLLVTGGEGRSLDLGWEMMSPKR